MKNNNTDEKNVLYSAHTCTRSIGPRKMFSNQSKNLLKSEHTDTHNSIEHLIDLVSKGHFVNRDDLMVERWLIETPF